MLCVFWFGQDRVCFDRRECAAQEHAAKGDHERAARCYTMAAGHYHLQAKIEMIEGDSQGATGRFLKVAALHAVAGKQEKAHSMGVLAALMAVGELGKCRLWGWRPTMLT